MTNEILIALLSFVGTLIGTLGGILAANKLTTFRIERLEEKVNKHNNLIERTYKLEGRVTEIEHDIRDLNNRI
ncbi:MAG: hypothetical protein IJP33_05830 [Firmicutes bacterium]|nr:hypothetical protein [Bacillota bacterium]